MTEIIFAFSVWNQASLVCLWIETGNPAQPLACKWIAKGQPAADPHTSAVVQAETHQLCA